MSPRFELLQLPGESRLRGRGHGLDVTAIELEQRGMLEKWLTGCRRQGAAAKAAAVVARSFVRGDPAQTSNPSEDVDSWHGKRFIIRIRQARGKAAWEEVAMGTPIMSTNDAARVAALQRYAILDSEPEQAFDDLTLLASYVCKTPIAYISLVDENRQWFKSKLGISANETSRDIAFCSLAIQQPDVFVVPDTFQDERFRTNPLVTSEPNIRFYAGAPLINEDGFALGTLCVIDRTPRELGADQEAALKALSRLVLAQMEFRRNLTLLKEALSDRTRAEHERERELAKVQETLFRVLGLSPSRPAVSRH